MNALMKLLKRLSAQGFATKGDKAEVQSLYTKLQEEDAEAAETVADDVAEVAKLPEEGEGGDDELDQGIKALFASHAKQLGAEQKAELKALEVSLKNEIKKFIEEQAELKGKEAGVYHPDVAEKRVKLNGYLRDLSMAMLQGDTAKVKEMTTDDTASPYGGNVVDRELSAEIRHLITEYGVARREFMAIALSKNSYDANTLVTDVTVGWVTEGGVIGSTQAVLGQEELKLKKLGAIVTLTRELLQDQEIDLFAFLAGRIAEGFARKEDQAAFVGEGTGDTANAEYTGALYQADANETLVEVRGSVDGTAFSHLHSDDLLNMQDSSPQSVAASGKYFMHRSIRNLVRKLKDDNGAPIYQSPSENGPALLWGKPVVEVEVMPSTADTAADTPFVIYGDLKKAMLMGYRNGMAADRFNAGVVRKVDDSGDVNLITTDREAMRFIERVGFTALMPDCITVLKTQPTS